MTSTAHGELIPDDEHFKLNRSSNQKEMAEDLNLRQMALCLQSEAERHKYTYQHEWCGVPIIRLPDDIIIFQEIVWTSKPSFIIETGIARGGSLILSASLMLMSQCVPKVFGIDIKILEHTKNSILSSPFSEYIETMESDSTSKDARESTANFISTCNNSKPGILVLDSNHTHNHVLSELNNLAPLLPAESLILVADTLIAEMPDDFYSNRPWGHGNNPLTAIDEFLSANSNYIRDARWGQRGLLSEFRNGIIKKIK